MTKATIEISFGCPRCDGENKCTVNMYNGEEHTDLIDIINCPHCNKKIRVETEIGIFFLTEKAK